MPRRLGATLAVALLGAGAVACGGQGPTPGSRSASARNLASGRPTSSSGRQASSIKYSYTGNYPHLPGRPLSLSLTRYLLDYPKLRSPILREHALMFAYYYGQPASAADTRAAALVVKRYYMVAGRGDARLACSMIPASVARGLPIEYGKDGPAYLRGASTCEAVLARIFRRSHHALTLPVTVRGVLAYRNQGYAFVNSRKLPVSVVPIERTQGGWIVASWLGSPVSMSGAASTSSTIGP